MIATSGSLPHGVACVRVEIPLGRIVVCSSSLTEEEARVARAVAFQKVKDGARAVVISMLELATVMREAA